MQETFTNNLINSTIFHLLNFEKYSNFQSAARQAAITNNFQIVLFSKDFNTIFSVETRHSATIEDAVRRSLDQDIDRTAKGIKVDVDGVTTYWGPITIQQERYYLMLVDNDKNYTQDEVIKLAEIIELAMGMWNYVPKRDATAELIRALRRGNRELAYVLLDELKMNENQLTGVYLVPGVKKDDALKKVAEFETGYDINTIKLSEFDEIAGVILTDINQPKEESEYGEPEWKSFAKQMSESGAPKTFHVTGISGVDAICDAFRLINETEAFVQLIFPHKHSFSKFELALAQNCVNICMNGGTVKRNYLDLIKPFRNATDTKTKQLMETLETFILDSGLSSSKAAGFMDVHVNTVQYRLKRIKDILGVDITANTIVPGLMMALAVSRIEKEAGPF